MQLWFSCASLRLLLLGLWPSLGDSIVSVIDVLCRFKDAKAFKSAKTSKRKRKREHIRLEAIAISNLGKDTVYIPAYLWVFFF